jgi:predicted phosphodiesterase
MLLITGGRQFPESLLIVLTAFAAIVAAVPIVSRADVTSPANSQKFSPFNFAVLSDLHLSEHNGPARFEKALDMIHQRGDVAFVLVLGDIVWDRDPDQFKSLIAKAGVPVHLVYGNNDWKWVDNGTYEKAFGPRDYSFTYANCAFIQMWDCLPREHLQNHRGELSEAQWSWLESQLAAAKQSGATHTFVSMHVPPAAPGAFNNLFFMFEQTQDRLLALFDQYDVSAGLFGHLHQNLEWTHGKTQMVVNPSCCWNFISRTQKVESSFVRIVKVEQNSISDELIPVHLEGETFTWDTLKDFYDAKTAPK